MPAPHTHGGHPVGAPPPPSALSAPGTSPLIIAGSMLAVILLVVVLGVAAVAIVDPQRFSSATSPTGGWPNITTPTNRTTTATTSAPTATTSAPTGPSAPTGEDALGGNPIFQTGGMSKQMCSPIGWPSDGAASGVFYSSALPCLRSAWEPLIRTAGMEYRDANVIVPTGASVTTPCGVENTGATSGTAAFYCSGNETVYMPLSGIEGYGDQQVIYLEVFAHEFGHHVQNLIGTMDEENRRAYDAGFDSTAGLELSRRLELQAQCFSGLLVEAVTDAGGPFTQTDYEVALEYAYHGDGPGAPRSHGTPENYQAWWSRGAQNQTEGCNTWRASPADVA